MIVAFTGKKQNGKSTAAAYVAEKYGFVRINFKDALVAETLANFPVLLDEIIEVMDRREYDGMNPWTHERLIKEKPPLMRALLQNNGT
jgi:adenylate kinase family enzyme